MIEKILNLFDYVKRNQIVEESNITPNEIVTDNIIDNTKMIFKYGDPCRSCGSPAYNNNGKNICYLCDTNNWD